MVRDMQFAHLATSFLAISQLLFTGTYFLIHHRKVAHNKLYALFCFCIIAYIADNLQLLDRYPALNNAASFFAILAPGVFWTICRYFFEDESHNSGWCIGIIVFYATLRFIGVLAEGTDLEPFQAAQFIFFTLPNVIMLALIFHTIYMAARGRSNDLVESRRSMRLLFSIVTAVLLLTVVSLETLLLPNTGFDNILYFIIFLVSLLTNIRLFELKSGLVVTMAASRPSLPVTREESTSPDSRDRKLIDQIQSLMEHECRYSTMGLTIPALASELHTTEHRLRRVINYQLHFRNFNQFLNYYRIAEASKRLKSPAEAHVPILTIAMDVGYRSLSAFNKAFMAKHQMTPSQYRVNTSNNEQ